MKLMDKAALSTLTDDGWKDTRKKTKRVAMSEYLKKNNSRVEKRGTFSARCCITLPEVNVFVHIMPVSCLSALSTTGGPKHLFHLLVLRAQWLRAFWEAGWDWEALSQCVPAKTQ